MTDLISDRKPVAGPKVIVSSHDWRRSQLLCSPSCASPWSYGAANLKPISSTSTCGGGSIWDVHRPPEAQGRRGFAR